MSSSKQFVEKQKLTGFVIAEAKVFAINYWHLLSLITSYKHLVSTEASVAKR